MPKRWPSSENAEEAAPRSTSPAMPITGSCDGRLRRKRLKRLSHFHGDRFQFRVPTCLMVWHWLGFPAPVQDERTFGIELPGDQKHQEFGFLAHALSLH